MLIRSESLTMRDGKLCVGYFGLGAMPEVSGVVKADPRETVSQHSNHGQWIQQL